MYSPGYVKAKGSGPMSLVKDYSNRHHLSRLLVLAYHHVSENQESLCVKPNVFEKQISSLRKRGFQRLSLDDYMIDILTKGEEIHPSKYIIITFDDGWWDNYANAFPIMQKYGYLATIFLTVAYIGKKKDYLVWEQVIEMKKAGFDFGSHTLTHPHLTKISLKEARKEIIESKKILEDKIGEKVVSFCYPYGEYNSQIIEIVKEAGYLGAVVTPPSGRCENSIYTIRRAGIYSADTILSFRIKTSGTLRILSSCSLFWKFGKTLKRWARV